VDSCQFIDLLIVRLIGGPQFFFFFFDFISNSISLEKCKGVQSLYIGSIQEIKLLIKKKWK
jgi:hypothetical protein